MTDNRTIQEKIADWIVILNSPEFKNTDAEIVRKEMLDLININSQEKQTHDGIQAGNLSQGKSESMKLENEKQSAKVGGVGLKTPDTHSQIKDEIDEDYDGCYETNNEDTREVNEIFFNKKFAKEKSKGTGGKDEFS